MPRADEQQNRDLWPIPFWGMTKTLWYEYVASLEGNKRSLFELYPFKWAYVPPHNPRTAVLFLRDIQVDDPPVDSELERCLIMR